MERHLRSPLKDTLWGYTYPNLTSCFSLVKSYLSSGVLLKSHLLLLPPTEVLSAPVFLVIASVSSLILALVGIAHISHWFNHRIELLEGRDQALLSLLTPLSGRAETCSSSCSARAFWIERISSRPPLAICLLGNQCSTHTKPKGLEEVQQPWTHGSLPPFLSYLAQMCMNLTLWPWIHYLHVPALWANPFETDGSSKPVTVGFGAAIAQIVKFLPAASYYP